MHVGQGHGVQEAVWNPPKRVSSPLYHRKHIRHVLDQDPGGIGDGATDWQNDCIGLSA
jgi:hypothetical protein